MSKGHSNELSSPDFKRVTSKLRVVKRRKRSEVLSDSKLLSSSEECVKRNLATRGRNPFKSLPANDTLSPALNNDSIESDCFLPGTPEKEESPLYAGSSEFVVPRTPDQPLVADHRFKRRRLTSEDYNLLAQPTRQTTRSSNSSSLEESTKRGKVVDELLPDYTLYSKVQLTSTYNLGSLVQTSDKVISQATSDFITGRDTQDGCAAQKFHTYIHYYMYPNLPWLSLFPRTAHLKATSMPLSQTAFTTLDSQWKSVFTSAYNSLVADLLPCGYFYMLCEGFTVLFHRCSKCDTTSAVVSPTSRGLRQNLQARGIEFKLPLQQEVEKLDKHKDYSLRDKKQDSGIRSNPNTSSGDLDRQSVTESEQNTSLVEGDDGDDPLEWLEGIGLEKSHFPSLRAGKVQMEEESFKRIDYRPASTVIVSGKGFVNRLKEFLKEYSRVVASTGELALVPPTIVSRSPFLGATVQKLELRTGQLTSEAGAETQSYIDMSKPVLPGMISDIMNNVIRPTVPHGTAVNTSMIEVGDSHVYNINKCSSDSCSPVCDGPKNSFLYKNSRFYFEGLS